jgi:hypothetical protein
MKLRKELLLLLLPQLAVAEPLTRTEITAGLAVHTFELILAVYICFAALRFFRITKPVNLFVIIYTAVGFLVVNILLYFLMYVQILRGVYVSSTLVYFAGRLAFIGMLLALATTFYMMQRQMRQA